MRNFASILVLLFCFSGVLKAQETEKTIKAFFDEALTDKTAYKNLEMLCKNYKGRITGSEQAVAAVNYTFQLMQNMNLDMVEKQPVQVPCWARGEREVANIQSGKNGKKEVPVSALGMSVGTGNAGLTAKVVEVQNFEELEKLGRKNIAGKIVFYNRPMDPTLINTFAAYGGAANQRTQGASEAA
jgi:hypothetical protein